MRLLSISFLLISISYLIQSLFNFFIISKANQEICRIIKIESILLFDTLGLYAHISFMTLGLTLLAYMSFRTEKKRILLLLVAISMFGVFLSMNALYLFFLFSSIYLVFISWYFIENFLRNRQKKTLLTAIAFLFLLFGTIHFIFSVNHQLFYAIGHILELFAYLLILSNLLLVLKK
ncbi:MAG: hypothetical protein ABIC95_04325 [archaeon]